MAEDKAPGTPPPAQAAPASEAAPKFSKADFESLKKLTDLLKVAGKLKEEIKGLNGSYEEFLDLVGDETASRYLQNLKDSWDDLNESLDGSVTTLRNAQLEFSLMARIGQTAYSQLSEAAKVTKLTNDESKLAAKELTKAISGISYGYQSIIEELAGINELGEKDLQNIVKKAQQDIMRLEKMSELLNLQGDELKQVQEQVAAAKKLQEYAEARLKLEIAIDKQMGVTGSLLKGAQGILSKFGGLDKHFNLEETNKKLRQMAMDQKGAMAIMKEGAKDVGASLLKAINDPLILVGLLGKALTMVATSALHFQQKMFETAKTLGVNVSQAQEMHHTFMEVSTLNSKMGLDSEQVSKTYSEMSNTLGVMVNQDKEFLAQSSAISRNFGLSAQQMELMQLRAKQTGKSVKDTFGEIVGTGKVMAQSLGISMTQKQIIEGISKTSATIFMNFKGNVQQLTEAVVKATKFGVTLEQINSAGSSMLSFESSISKEFEAQLLTGKEINLQKAREYALTGQTDKLMEEITRNLGDQTSWNKMNVIQQQSLAEAMGMSKEQVDEMYRKQTMINVLGKDANLSETERYQKLLEQKKSRAEIAEMMGQEAVARAEEASAQEQMKAAMKDLSEFAGAIAMAFLPITFIVEKISAGIKLIASGGTAVKLIFGGIAAAMLLAVGYMSVMAVKAQIRATTEARQLVSMKLKNMLAQQEAAAEQRSAIASTTSANNSAREAVTEAAVIPAKVTGAAADTVSAGASAGAANAPLTFGIGSIGIILGVAAALATVAGMFGGLPGMGGGSGASSGPSMADSMNSAQKSISPTSPLTAMSRTQSMGAGADRGLNVSVYNEVEPITAKTTTKVMTQGNGFDGQTGGNAQQKTVRRTGGV